MMLNSGVQWGSNKNIVTVSILHVDVYSFQLKEGRLSRPFLWPVMDSGL